MGCNFPGRFSLYRRVIRRNKRETHQRGIEPPIGEQPWNVKKERPLSERERCNSISWGAQPSRLQFGASRAEHLRQWKSLNGETISRPDTSREDATQSARDGRAPLSNCIVPAEGEGKPLSIPQRRKVSSKRPVKTRALIYALFLALFGGLCVVSNAAPPLALPKVVYADPQALAEAKAKFAAKDPSLKPAFERLLENADRALRSKPVSVMDKNRLPPSGDKHDFLSQAPYFWQDANGKYVRRDGERNPESGRDSDAGRVGRLNTDVHALALAYYFTGKEEYAAHAAELLRVWFLNPDTRMNPNLNFGQGIPGEVDGRPMGIIGTRGFVGLVDAIGLLHGSKAWTATDQQGMVDWMSKYLDWLQTSKIGIGERDATNNHGTFYDTQAAAIAAFAGRADIARSVIEDARENRIAKQIEPDGKMPRELQRTKSFSYSAFNLRALLDLASIGQNLGIDLWHFETPDGRSIRKALDFMAPYVSRDSQWPYQEIGRPNRESVAILLLRAAPEYHGANYEQLIKNSPSSELTSSEERLLFKMPNLLPAKTQGTAVPPRHEPPAELE